MVTVGLDLHKRYMTACAVDDAGTVVAEHRRARAQPRCVRPLARRAPAPAHRALEATLYWHWLERQLAALGITVIVAHPYQVKLIWQARTKTDPIDARKLAELARVDLLPTIWISRSRDARVAPAGPRPRVPRAATHGDAEPDHASLTAENLRCPAVDLYTKAGQAWLATVSRFLRSCAARWISGSSVHPSDQ